MSMHFFEELRKVLGVLSWPVCSTPSWQPPRQVRGVLSFILLVPGQVSLISGRGGTQTEYIPILLSYVLVGEGSQPAGAEGTGEGAPGGCGSPWRMWEPCTHIEEYSACPRQYLHCASSSQHPACLLHVHSALGAHNCLRNELLWLAACDCGTQLPRSV